MKWSEVTQSCPTLCDPMDCSLPGFSIHGILQARILEWVTISFSRGSSQPRDRTRVSHIGGRCFNLWATRELLPYHVVIVGTHLRSSGNWASLLAQLVKNPPAMQETLVWSLGWEDPLEKGKATHSSILAWRIPWTYSPWVHKESDMTEWLSLHFHLRIFMLVTTLKLWLLLDPQ